MITTRRPTNGTHFGAWASPLSNGGFLLTDVRWRSQRARPVHISRPYYNTVYISFATRSATKTGRDITAEPTIYGFSSTRCNKYSAREGVHRLFDTYWWLTASCNVIYNTKTTCPAQNNYWFNRKMTVSCNNRSGQQKIPVKIYDDDGNNDNIW